MIKSKDINKHFSWFMLLGAGLFPIYYWVCQALDPSFYDSLPLRMFTSLVLIMVAFIPWHTKNQLERGWFFINLFMMIAFMYISAMNKHAFPHMTGMFLLLCAYPIIVEVQRITYFYTFCALSLLTFLLSPILLQTDTFSLTLLIKAFFIITAEAMFLFVAHTSKRIKNQAKMQELFNTSIANSIPGFIWSYQNGQEGIKNCKHHFVSQQWEEITGYPVKFLKYDPLFLYQITMDKDKPVFQKALDKLKTFGGACFQHRIVRKGSQELRWMESRFSGTFDDNDRLTRVDVITLDKTELINMEDQTKHTQRVMIHSQKMISLGKIFERLIQDTQDPKLILETIEKLKHFSASNNQNDSKVNLQSVIEASLSIIRPSLEVKNIQLKTDICEHTLYIDCNFFQLQQCLLSLLNNAVEAMEKTHGGILTVRVYHHSMEIYIEIEDTGIGISEKDKSNVFEPFYTTKTVGLSSGIGLSMIKSLIRDYDGRIVFESEELEGTLFRLQLPHYDMLKHKKIQERDLRVISSQASSGPSGTFSET